MMYGADICERARESVRDLERFQLAVQGASVASPEAISRNTPFLREQIEMMREAIAAVEAKLPKPEAVRNAA